MRGSPLLTASAQRSHPAESLRAIGEAQKRTTAQPSFESNTRQQSSKQQAGREALPSPDSKGRPFCTRPQTASLCRILEST